MNEEERAGFDGVFAAIAGSIAYRDAVREAFPETPDWVLPFNAVDFATLGRISDALNVGRGERFVDLACGMGGPGLWTAQKTGARLTGIDFSPSAIAVAEGIARERHIEAQFICADATDTGLPAGKFDALMSLDAIQFMPPDAVCTEMARLVKPGGRIAVTTWETVVDNFPRATMVKDYEPYLAQAGIDLYAREIVEGYPDRQRAFYTAVLARSGALRAQAGEPAESLIEEAQSGLDRDGIPPRVRRVILFAQKR